jgi:hypothetical protein
MANGWELAMTLVPLPGGGVLVHSPTWLGDDTFARVLEVGEPRAVYRAWLLRTIEQEQPRTLWMSHGDALVADDLPERLSALVRQRV